MAVESSVQFEQTGAVRSNVLVGGGYAWLATVAGPAFEGDSPLVTRITAVLALAALVAGVLGSARLGNWGRPLTLAGFLGLTAMTWIGLGDALETARLEPVRAAFGGLGWMLFAFSWGAVRERRAIPEDAPNVIHGEPLLPRQRRNWYSLVALGLALISALAVWSAAFSVEHRFHAVLAHAVALACGMGLLAGGSRIAVLVGGERNLPLAHERFNSAASSAAGLAGLAVLGLLVWVLTR